MTTKPSKREDLSQKELDMLNEIMEKHYELKTIRFGDKERSVIRYDKRPDMYGGTGTVYLIQMFKEKNELINNRIGAFMILPSSEDSIGFHEHGPRNEQELYLILEGQGEYLDKDGINGEVRSFPVKKGNITTVDKTGFHSIKNTGDEPLIIFVITTYSAK